ncbi:MAG TPA: glucokinase [Vicinamibacterales bacterium]|nr:glucokinase [Vicinamibacterales bacterium]
MLLAGDVGGTKTTLGLFEPARPRPRAVATQTYATREFEGFTEILDAFAHEVGRPLAVSAAAVGVAGPVVAQRATLTNVPWQVSAQQIADRLRTPQALLLNDLEAMAASVEFLTRDEMVVLQEGIERSDGNAVVIAAGTGLGEAYLHRVNGRLRPVASEGGHADFAARTDREIELVRMLRDRNGRVEIEQVISGPGLVNLFRFTHRGGQCSVNDSLEDASPERITQGALSGRCQFCAEALRMFIAAYGAEAGNLALRGVASAGVYIGGGIAPKILSAFQDGTFMDAFRDKAPMADLVSRVPVRVIVLAHPGLIGAAVHALEMVEQ